MRIHLAVLFASLFLYASPMNLSIPTARADAAPTPQAIKEWTFLVFINGHNNLDRYGAMNINQMEQVGSTDQVNVLVQWASAANPSTRRLYIKKDNDPSNVTSPVVQDLGKVDMGDWHNLVDFVRWAHANYPAKHYFIDVWDHGTGWHLMHQRNRGIRASDTPLSPMDISFDDNTGNAITTQQLGQALEESARVIGHKVDLYGSDACLMAMAEIASEMAGSVDIFAGSEEVEPVAGWPYDQLLRRWVANPRASASQVASILTDEYIKSYQGGENGTMEVTFSAFDLSKMGRFNEAVASLGSKLMTLDATARKKVVDAIQSTQSFTYSDYGDLGDFMNLVERGRAVDSDVLARTRAALGEFVITSQTTPRYSKAKGVAMWLPGHSWTFDSYISKYRPLQFHQETHWGNVMETVLAGSRRAVR